MQLGSQWFPSTHNGVLSSGQHPFPDTRFSHPKNGQVGLVQILTRYDSFQSECDDQLLMNLCKLADSSIQTHEVLHVNHLFHG